MGPGEQVTNGDNVLSWWGENRAILGESFGDDFVESRICAIWPILDDGVWEKRLVIINNYNRKSHIISGPHNMIEPFGPELDQDHDGPSGPEILDGYLIE